MKKIEIIFLLFFVALYGCNDEEEPQPNNNNLPTSFTATNDNCNAPCDPGFMNTTPNSTNYTWQWRFGDGSDYSNEKNPKHVYTQPGEYDVHLLSFSSEGSGGSNKKISIRPPCTGIVCGQHSHCNPNTNDCNCNDGWDGADCSIPASSKFEGTFTAQEDCTFGSYTNTITIHAIDSSRIRIDKMLDNHGLVPAAIFRTTEEDLLSLNITFDAMVSDNEFGLVHYKGTGKYSESLDAVLGTYIVVYESGLQETCDFAYVKQ